MVILIKVILVTWPRKYIANYNWRLHPKKRWPFKCDQVSDGRWTAHMNCRWCTRIYKCSPQLREGDHIWELETTFCQLLNSHLLSIVHCTAFYSRSTIPKEDQSPKARAEVGTGGEEWVREGGADVLQDTGLTWCRSLRPVPGGVGLFHGIHYAVIDRPYLAKLLGPVPGGLDLFQGKHLTFIDLLLTWQNCSLKENLCKYCRCLQD